MFTCCPRHWRFACQIVRVSPLMLLACCSLLSASVVVHLSGDEILAKLAQNNVRRRAILSEYSAVRDYTIQNSRFRKHLTAAVRMSYRSGQGTRFTMLNSSGSKKLVDIVEQVLAEEENSSRAPDGARHEIEPANYRALLVGVESVGGHNCYVLELRPRIKSKYLIQGKAWIDAESYTIVRLEGRTAGGVSTFLGRPFYIEEFSEVDGVWLPSHTRVTSSSLLLGVSELDIVYRDYELPSVLTQSLGR